MAGPLHTPRRVALVLTSCVMMLLILASALGVRAWNITSGSMEPAIPTGSAVLTVPTDPLEVGRVYVYRDESGGRFVAHRLVGIDSQGRAVFKGDALSGNDTPVGREDVRGQVVAQATGAGAWVPVAGTLVWVFLIAVIAAVSLAPPRRASTTEEATNRSRDT